MSATPVQSTTCGHPFARGGICEACRLRSLHDGQATARDLAGPAGTCICVLCRFIEGLEALDDDRRTLMLESWAEQCTEEAAALYHAAGHDTGDLEAHVRGSLTFPPPSLRKPHSRLVTALRSMRYDSFLQTPEWAEHRRRAIKRADGRCQGCDTTEHLEVHHRTYERRGEEHPTDLTVLCAGCHTAVHLVADGRRGKIRDRSRRAKL